jgi:pyruvate formate lyase activating enzyme
VQIQRHLSSEEQAALRNVQGRLHSRETFGTVDGPGVRYVFFLQGCCYRCLYCHNPDSIPLENGEVWRAGDVEKEALRYRNYIKNGGVTFSGGEPLLQAEFVRAASALLRAAGLHVAVDTAGLPLTARVRAAVDEADLLLLDIKAIDDDVAVRLSGRTNRDALSMLDYCEQANKPVWIRHVLLRGYTLDDAQLERLAAHLKPYKCVERVELLPFHKLGEPKWLQTGRDYALYDVEATTKDEAARARDILGAHGLNML